MRVLITSGGTEEALDGVRTLSNKSTGKTGAALADFFSIAGDQVEYCHSERAATPTQTVCSSRFSDLDSLEARLLEILSKKSIDLIIHAAAVSDYQLEKIEILENDEFREYHPKEPHEKLGSNFEKLRLTLKKAPKLIAKLHALSLNPKVKVVGFKLSTAQGEQKLEEIKRVFSNSGVEWVVFNRPTNFGATHPEFELYSRDRGTDPQLIYSHRELGEKIRNQFMKKSDL